MATTVDTVSLGGLLDSLRNLASIHRLRRLVVSLPGLEFMKQTHRLIRVQSLVRSWWKESLSAAPNALRCIAVELCWRRIGQRLPYRNWHSAGRKAIRAHQRKMARILIHGSERAGSDKSSPIRCAPQGRDEVKDFRLVAPPDGDWTQARLIKILFLYPVFRRFSDDPHRPCRLDPPLR